jgi:hypothetical protein
MIFFTCTENVLFPIDNANIRWLDKATADDNVAMTATAMSVGFRLISPEKVWWKYPELPDF